MEEPTNSELYRGIVDIKEMVKDHGVKLESIETQTVKTNGRVNQLESDCDDLKQHVDSLRLWRNLLIGGGIVISAIGIGTATILMTVYKQNLVNETAEKVITLLENKYTVTIDD